MSKLILVTGGCGFIGSNLIPKLIEQGDQVRVLDNLSRGRSDYLTEFNCEIVKADIRNIDSCRDAFKGVDKVVHLAAYGSVVESVENPAENFDINVKGTLNILRLIVENNIEKLVFSSTGGALIGNASPPVSEQSLPKPISPYGAGKLCCEAYCNAFSESYNLNAICLRFANVYGPNSAHKTGVINKFAKRIIDGKSLVIYGDGASTRDYIHVSDLCNGIVLALQKEKLESSVVHIATGIETSLQELADLFLTISGSETTMIDYQPARVGEVERNFALYDLANEVFGYAPSIQLKDGLTETYEYLKSIYQK